MRFVAILRNSTIALLLCVAAASASEAVYVQRDADGVYHFSDVPVAGGFEAGAADGDRAQRLWRAAERHRVERQCERIIRAWAMTQGFELAPVKPAVHTESPLDLLAPSTMEALMKIPEARKEIAALRRNPQ